MFGTTFIAAGIKSGLSAQSLEIESCCASPDEIDVVGALRRKHCDQMRSLMD
jgi:hypothetical protein